MHRITDNWVILVVRLALGVFLAFFFAAIIFVVARLFIVIPTPTTTLITIGFGSGLGGAVGWLNPDSPKTHLLFMLIVGVLGGLAGAWVGMLYGGTVYIMGGMPGIAELSSLVRGAAIGGNIPPIVVGLIRIMRTGD